MSWETSDVAGVACRLCQRTATELSLSQILLLESAACFAAPNRNCFFTNSVLSERCVLGSAELKLFFYKFNFDTDGRCCFSGRPSVFCALFIFYTAVMRGRRRAGERRVQTTCFAAQRSVPQGLTSNLVSHKFGLYSDIFSMILKYLKTFKKYTQNLPYLRCDSHRNAVE